MIFLTLLINCFINIFIFVFHIYKCLNVYQLNIIKKTKKCYKKNTLERYENLSNEEKEKKRQYCCERYNNLPEYERQKLVEYRKKNYRMRKALYYNYFFK